MGAQPLYNVTARWTPTSNPASAEEDVPGGRTPATVSAVRRVGFRVFALVTTNDTDVANVNANATADGSDNHGMFYRVNGAAMYSRGANMVPMEELEGRLTGAAHRILVKSSAGRNPPLATENLLEVTDGGRSTLSWISRGGSLRRFMYADGRALC